MKIPDSKVNIAPAKGLPRLDASLRKVLTTKINTPKSNAAAPLPSLKPPQVEKKPLRLLVPVVSPIKNETSSLKVVAAAVQQIRLSAQRELEQARKMRADALRYQQETATKARSEAHQLTLHARLTTQREIEELIREASEEIQKVLADIRVIRITAQEELAAQRKFTDAAKISSMSISIKEELARNERKKKRQLVGAKA